MTLFGAVLFRVVRAVFAKLFVPSGRTRASILAADQDLLCSELFDSELFGQPDMSCSCTLKELEPLHKEFVCLIRVIFLCYFDIS